MKDPLPEAITWHGVTLYGSIDVGAVYQDHGAPISGALPTGFEYNITGSSNNGHKIASIAPNGISQSFVGLKVEENIGGGWVALAKIESGFVPTSGEIADGCASLARNNGLNAAQAQSKGDSSRCGQALNGPVYAGVSNAGYGTLTIGRQNSLQLEALAAYDPQGLAYAFSLVGYSGFAAGAGDTEDGRWDNALKYVYQYGPMHAAAMYTNGGQDTGIQNGAYALNIGGKYKGLSVDAVYTKEKGAVSAASLSATNLSAGISRTALGATISDNEMWSVQGKYTFELGGGGFKDDGPGAKLTVYAGYENVTFSNPSDGVPTNATTLGGYVLGVVNNGAFVTDKTQQLWWTGAKYELPSGWSFTGAYYHYDVGSFITNQLNGDGTVKNVHADCATTTAAVTLGKKVGSNCAGTLDSVSFVADYQFNKHFDIYAGVQFGEVSGGQASGFLNDNMTTVMTGARLKF
jgi:predicted porin